MAAQLKSCASAPYLLRMVRLSGWSAGLLSASLLLLPPGAAPAASKAPKTGVIAGSVKNNGGVLTAGPKGAEYQLPSQARLLLAPGSSVRVFPVSQRLQLSPGSKTTTYSFALLQGRVDVDVPTKPHSAVLCSIGKLSSIVSGGRATLLAGSESSTVASFGGDVRTLFNDHWQTLAPGTLARFGLHHSGSPVPAIAAPKLVPGQRLWFAPGEPVDVAGIALAPSPGAQRYELRLRRSDGSGEQLRKLRGTRLNEAFTGLEPGQYQLDARAVDAEGIEGQWSPAETLRVVGVSLPPGGYAEGGDIFIGKGQEVHFSHTDGLEMTYEGAGRYIPASEAVSLYRGETTMVSFRVPGSVYPTSARLRPRTLYAHVAMGPSRAVWPTDPIDIVIELRSKAGASVPAWVELKPEVKLGIEPIEVSFTRSGNRLVGTVKPTDKPGPWVLRVEVKDQFGALLGRDFLEIAPAPPPPPKASHSKALAAAK